MNLEEKIQKLLESIPEEGVSVHQLSYRTGLDYRSIKKYLELIVEIQKRKPISKTQDGLRLFFKQT